MHTSFRVDHLPAALNQLSGLQDPLDDDVLSFFVEGAWRSLFCLGCGLLEHVLPVFNLPRRPLLLKVANRAISMCTCSSVVPPILYIFGRIFYPRIGGAVRISSEASSTRHAAPNLPPVSEFGGERNVIISPLREPITYGGEMIMAGCGPAGPFFRHVPWESVWV